MKIRTKTYLASVALVSTGNLSDLLSSRRHASYPLALRLAQETGTDPALWLRGGTGTSESRRAAVAKWAAEA